MKMSGRIHNVILPEDIEKYMLMQGTVGKTFLNVHSHAVPKNFWKRLLHLIRHRNDSWWVITDKKTYKNGDDVTMNLKTYMQPTEYFEETS